MAYHGTTAEQLPSLRQHGLRKGTHVARTQEVARMYAQRRAGWNGQQAVVLHVVAGAGQLTRWQTNRKDQVEEARTTVPLRSWGVVSAGC